MSDNLTEQIIGAAIEVHRNVGPGLLENVYEECMAHELKLRGLNCERQKSVPIEYKGQRVAADLKIDLWIDHRVVFATEQHVSRPPDQFQCSHVERWREKDGQ